MFDCHKQLLKFHDDNVTLTGDMKSKMRGRRDANEARLKRGLEKAGKPLPLRFIKQGSYAMHTMVQAEIDASDIDDGVVFRKSDLVGPRGGEFTPQDAKVMVRDAVDDGSFKKPPEVHTNCVRIYYDDGFSIDMPVYREVEENGTTKYELASAEWKHSDPEAVTNWFNTQVIDKSPDENDGRQMRRVVRFLKAWAKSRKSWNMPSGFIFSVLTNEMYPNKDQTLLNRDDIALLRVMEGIHLRLTINLTVNRPVPPNEAITKSDNDAAMVQARERLSDAISSLQVLRSATCTELDALNAWKDFFATDAFDERISELESSKKSESGSAFVITGKKEPEQQVQKRGGEDRYA